MNDDTERPTSFTALDRHCCLLGQHLRQTTSYRE